MSILKLVSESGTTIGTPNTARPPADREIVLPGITLAQYVDLGTRFDEAGFAMMVRAADDARRHAGLLSARMPLSDAVGAPDTWDVVGCLISRLLPVIGTMAELDAAAMAMRTVVRMVLDGDELGASMQLSAGLLSVHGDGVEGTITLNLLEGPSQMTMRFEIDAHGANLVE